MNQQAGKKRSLRTGARVALACAAFAATALVASNCKSDDTANLAAKQAANQAAQQPGAPKVTVTSSQGGRPASPQPQPQLDTVPAVAWDAEIVAVDGAPFRLSDYKDKVVVLDLWATWCGPCRLEVPHLVDLTNEYKGKGVEVIGLTTEGQSEAEKVRDFAREFKVNYRLGYARADVALALMNGNTSIPQTFVIAPGGRIVMKVRGFRNDIADMIRGAVNQASDKTGD